MIGQCRDYDFELGFSAKTPRAHRNARLLRPTLARTRKPLEVAKPPPGQGGCKERVIFERMIRERGSLVLSFIGNG